MMTVARAKPMPDFIQRPTKTVPEEVPQVEGQHGVEHVAPGHAPQHPPRSGRS